MGKKLYKILSTISITGIFVVVAVLVCAITGLLKINYVVGFGSAIIAVLCISCILSLPWLKQLEEKTNKIVSIIFLVSIIACAVIWIVCIVFIIIATKNEKPLDGMGLNLIRISLVLTIQVLVASTIANVILKYKKSMIPFQVITYISNLFVDMYFTILLLSLKINENSLSLKNIPDFLGSKIMLTLLFIALIYVLLSNTIMKVIDKKKNKTSDENELNKIEDNQIKVETPDEKLEHLKELYSKELITQEEYDKKKEEILKDL